MSESDTVYLVWHYDYKNSGVVAAYTDEALAKAHAEHEGRDHGVEAMELRNALPTWRPYYHGMAQVGCANPVLDRAPFVERAGETDAWEPDPSERVATWSERVATLGDAVWLSVFDMNRDRAFQRVAEKYAELVERRKSSPLPSWFDFIREEVANGDR